MPDVLHTLKSENTSPSASEDLTISDNWNNNISQPIKHFIITEAAFDAEFGLTKGYSLKPAMYYKSNDASTEKTVSIIHAFKNALQNISSTISSTIEDTEIGPIDDNGPFQMSLSADLIWTFIFGSMIGCAILGNLVVIWIVLGNLSVLLVITYNYTLRRNFQSNSIK